MEVTTRRAGIVIRATLTEEEEFNHQAISGHRIHVTNINASFPTGHVLVAGYYINQDGTLAQRKSIQFPILWAEIPLPIREQIVAEYVEARGTLPASYVVDDTNPAMHQQADNEEEK